VVQAQVTNPLVEKRPKQFDIGGALLPKKDLHRFVKCPKVVRIQCQRRILKQRLKVPSALHQFTRTLDKNLGIFPGLHLFMLRFAFQKNFNWSSADNSFSEKKWFNSPTKLTILQSRS
jgi:hypothetical protein